MTADAYRAPRSQKFISIHIVNTFRELLQNDWTRRARSCASRITQLKEAVRCLVRKECAQGCTSVTGHYGKAMGKIKVFPTPHFEVKQPRDPIVPRVPCTGMLLGPSKSGKTVALISMLLEQYRTASGESVWERLFCFSPSIHIDDAWKPVIKFIEEEMGVNMEREKVLFDTWDEGAIRNIIEQQRRITKKSKELGLKKLYGVCILVDDFSDQPELHKRNGEGALDTLLCLGRHLQISTFISCQKLRVVSNCIRVNLQFMCVWRLRNALELQAVIEELSALLSKDELLALYHEATREPYSFLFIYFLKPKSEAFHVRFEQRFVIDDGPAPVADHSQASRGRADL